MAISIGDIDYDAIFISAIHNHLGSRKTYYCFCSKMGYSLANGGEICEYRDRVLIKFLLVLFFFCSFYCCLLIPCSFLPWCYYSGAVACVFASLFGAIGSLTTTRQTFSFERMRMLTTLEHALFSALFPTLFHIARKFAATLICVCVRESFIALRCAGINFNKGMAFALFHFCLRKLTA